MLLTTSGKGRKDLFVEYRHRNDIEYDLSELQSDLFVGIEGKSDQLSAEGGLLVSFLRSLPLWISKSSISRNML